MMIDLPESAKVGRIIAKEKFYGKTDTATKNLFQNEIARITWEYKLAPETINLPAKHWPEIEVFRITLKNYELPTKVLKVIDSAIPYPILFFVEKGTAKRKPSSATKSRIKKTKTPRKLTLILKPNGTMKNSQTSKSTV